MKVKSLKSFRDLQRKRHVAPDEQFEVDTERGKQLLGLGLVEEVKKQNTMKITLLKDNAEHGKKGDNVELYDDAANALLGKGEAEPYVKKKEDKAAYKTKEDTK